MVVVEVQQRTLGYRAQDPKQDRGLHTFSTTPLLSPGEAVSTLFDQQTPLSHLILGSEPSSDWQADLRVCASFFSTSNYPGPAGQPTYPGPSITLTFA